VYAGKSALDISIAEKLLTRISKIDQDAPVDALTEREMDVLMLTGKGYTNKAIGVQLHISDRTVQGHLAHIFDKLHASSRTEAVMRAVSQGLLPSDLGEIGE
jgi:DNA-binding NarL/FixJ family response regulator